MKKRPKKFPVKYENGTIYVTQKGTAKKAEKPFRECLMYDIWKTQWSKGYRGVKLEERVARIFNEVIEDLRVNGFTDDAVINWLDHLRNCYVKMPRRAPRKKVKKEFDAKGLPKVGKTPLDEPTAEFLAALKEFIASEKWASDALKVDKTR
jgi:hypothetical protein